MFWERSVCEFSSVTVWRMHTNLKKPLFSELILPWRRCWISSNKLTFIPPHNQTQCVNPNRILPDNLEWQSKLWYWKITNALWLLASPLPWLLALSLVSSNEGKPRVAGYKRHRVQELLIAVERYSPIDWIFKNLASDLCSRYDAFTQLSVLYNIVGMLRVKGEGFGSEV